jgi:hypothetical protein
VGHAVHDGERMSALIVARHRGAATAGRGDGGVRTGRGPRRVRGRTHQRPGDRGGARACPPFQGRCPPSRSGLYVRRRHPIRARHPVQGAEIFHALDMAVLGAEAHRTAATLG